MSNFNNRYPVDGSSALRIDEAAAPTQIIRFPEHAHQPKHAKPVADEKPASAARRIARHSIEAIEDTEMVQSLRYGTCAGKPVGKMTSIQAAGASLAFFLFFMGTLLFM